MSRPPPGGPDHVSTPLRYYRTFWGSPLPLCCSSVHGCCLFPFFFPVYPSTEWPRFRGIVFWRRLFTSCLDRKVGTGNFWTLRRVCHQPGRLWTPGALGPGPCSQRFQLGTICRAGVQCGAGQFFRNVFLWSPLATRGYPLSFQIRATHLPGIGDLQCGSCQIQLWFCSQCPRWERGRDRGPVPRYWDGSYVCSNDHSRGIGPWPPIHLRCRGFWLRHGSLYPPGGELPLGKGLSPRNS